MARKEVSIENYTVDRKYASHITLEEFIRRLIRSHADADTEKAGAQNRRPSGIREAPEP